MANSYHKGTLELYEGARVLRQTCPKECGGEECPRHVPPGSPGTIVGDHPEPWVWARNGKSVHGLAWRVDWDDYGGYWTLEHGIDPDDSPGFPEGVWTDGGA